MSLSSLVEWVFPLCSHWSPTQWALAGLGLAGSVALAWLMLRRQLWPLTREKDANHWKEAGAKGRWSLSAGARLGIGVLVYLALLWGLEYRIKGSEPYRMALEMARASQSVKGVLGASFEEGWFVEAEIQEGADGFAVLAIPLKGGERRGTLRVRASKRDHRWMIVAMSLEWAQCGEPSATLRLLD